MLLTPLSIRTSRCPNPSTLPSRHRPGAGTRRVRLCARLLVALALGAALLVPPLGAQTAAQPAAQAGLVPPESDPAQDILIQGLGFSKLVLGMEVADDLGRTEAFRPVQPLLEKNLCWSGVFNLAAGRTRYCPAPKGGEHVDMRLALTLEQGQGVLRLYDPGPEQLVLFEDVLPLDGKTDEEWVMDVVNRLTERITGAPGLLGSTIGFVLRQPGYAKVVVATTTHGSRLRLLSHNRDINILPRFNRQGKGMVYTVLGRRGSQVFYEHLDTKDDQPIKSHFLTPPGSLNSGGAFSPDGTRVIVTMSVNQNADLFLFDLRAQKHYQLTSRTGIETQAHWSPDGEQLVFVSDRSGSPQIYLMDLDTREDIRLTFDGLYNADPRWSPDGKSILFTKRVNGVDQIHIMDQYGENVRMVTRGRFTSEQAEWSPDGRQVVFASNRTGEYKLYVVSTDGSNLRRLTNTPAGFEENSPTWTARRLVR